MFKIILIGIIVAAAVNGHPHSDVNEQEGLRSDKDCPQKVLQFESVTLQLKTRCTQLSKHDCMFIHEAEDKCRCICENRRSGVNVDGDPTDDNEAGSDDVNPTTVGSQLPAQGNEPVNKGPELCFHGDGLVETNKGQIKLKDVYGRKDVSLLAWNQASDKMELSPIVFWLHADLNQQAEFLQIRTEKEETLMLTKNHVIYRSHNCQEDKLESVMASAMNIGDCVLTIHGRQKVLTIDTVTRTGIYAPVTALGSVIVNGVAASCYANNPNEQLQRFVFSVGTRVVNVLNYLSLSENTSQTDVPLIFLAVNKLQNYVLA